MGLNATQIHSSESRRLDVRAALKTAMARLRADHVPSHTLAAELLLMQVLGRDRAWLYAHPEETLAPAHAEAYFDLIAQRSAGTPTQYLTGRQEFWGLEFHVEPGVLIPRPETEHVVEVALERLGPPDGNDRRPRGTGLRVADVGTGCGCIAIALARELPGAGIFATDVSQAALVIARGNACRHTAQVHFVCCDLLSSFRSESPPSNVKFRPFDLVVSNPPYVGRVEEGGLPREVREHEPPQALFGGNDGHEIYAPLVRQARQLLAPGGQLVLELSHNALDRVRPLLDASGGWTKVTVTNDLAGLPRVIAAERS